MTDKLKNLLLEFKKLERTAGPIRLRNFTLSKSDDSVQNFLFNFFTNYNKVLATENLKGLIITDTNKRRSINELFDLVKYYFPKVRKTQYFAAIYHAAARIWTETSYFIFVHWCGNVSRHVIYLCKRSENPGYFEPTHSYFVSNKNKFFPINFVWTYISYKSDFWKNFYDEEVTLELVGDIYKNLAG